MSTVTRNLFQTLTEEEQERIIALMLILLSIDPQSPCPHH